MFFKDPITLLAECAEADLNYNLETTIEESKIISAYDKIEELEEEVNYAAEFVPVMKIADNYYTEMQYLAPYMQNNDIRNVAEALNNIAEANNLAPKEVGLIVESQDCVTDKINEALGKKNTKFLGKVKKGEDLVSKLKSNGFKVKKKKSSKKESGLLEAKNKKKNKKAVKYCPECGLPINECKCSKKESVMFDFSFS